MDLYLLAPEISLFALAALVVIVDLFTERKRLLAALSLVGLAVPLAFSLNLLLSRQSGLIFGQTLASDDFTLFFRFLFLGIAALIILSSVDYVARLRRFQGEYYALVLLSAGGMMLMAAARELITIYIALELTGISLYALSGFLRDPKSSEASLKFLLLGALSSAVLLYGMALIFGLTGTTDLGGIAQVMNSLSPSHLGDNPALLMGLILLVAGFGFKIASVPFQMWVPDVYEGAPTPITAYLSVASKAAGFAIILRVFYTAFGSQAGVATDWASLFAILAAISMTLGNLVAIAQTNIKRLMGYSSIAQAGYLMVGLATLSPLGRSGVAFFLVSYALTNLVAFAAIIAISNKINSDLIADFSGMARRAPWLALTLALAMISLVGIPPTAGFWAKIYLFNGAVQQGLVWLVVLAVINSVISAYYYIRVVKVIYWGAPSSEGKVPTTWPLGVALLVATAGVLLLGVLPTPVLRLAEGAVLVFSP